MASGTGPATHPAMDPLLARHIAACNNFVLPGSRIELRIGSETVGYVSKKTSKALCAIAGISGDDEAVTLDQHAARALPGLAAVLAREGLCHERGELFDVRAEPDGPVLGQVDRGLLPMLGIAAQGVHLNGLVRRSDGVHLWVARRARTKLLDAGKLDHLVAGGVAAGMDAVQTLEKEAAEEAGLPLELARRAVPAGVVRYDLEREEGLRRDTLFCFDLDLPDDFVPQALDGEVEAFELWPVSRALETVRHTDHFKFNVSLVLIELFRRLGMA